MDGYINKNCNICFILSTKNRRGLMYDENNVNGNGNLNEYEASLFCIKN